MTSASRRNLVVVRAGRNSLHPTWLQSGAERNWDLVVSTYDPEALFDPQEDVQVVVKPGGKWDGIHSLFTSIDLLARYDFIWLPDDDIATRAEDINAIFDAMSRHHLEVAQPSLTRDSYFTHFLCFQCPGFALRFSNFIEIMVPCVSAGLLAQVLEDFRESESGFGMDFIWTRLAAEPRYKAAILDSIAVRHTRPVGKFLRGKMAERGRNPEDDRTRLENLYGLRGRALPVIYAAIDEWHRASDNRAALGWIMARRYLSVLGEFRYKLVALEKIVQILRRQIGPEPELEPLRSIKR